MTRRRLEKETEKLIELFHNYLTMNKGLSEETASEHAERIRFFAFHYLIGYEGKSLLEVTGYDIEDYLGNWYIRKVLNSGNSDVRPALIAFKKFFKFLHENGKISKEQLEDILSACEDPQKYIRRFETYFELDPESETWDEDFERWFMGQEEEIEVNYEQPFEVNEEITGAFSEDDLKSSTASVLNDFQTFLNYISANNGMKLTAASSFIGRKHVFALNEAMSSPEELKSTANQPDSRTIHLFYNVSMTLDLFVVSAKNTLTVTPRIDIFKMLSPKEQFVVLFDAMWNETSWEKFLQPNSGGRPEWAQARRWDMAYLFSRCESGETYLFKEQLKEAGMELENTEDELEGYWMMAEFILSVFVE
ncbi:MAG: site-specific integrase, partial [Methanomicrobia archaeon]|nr:site-specific integrase [Methanomicrobia archaeon]